MQTTLNHLSLNHRERLQLLVTEIVKAIAPEKIICYGFQLNAEQHWNVSQSWHNRHDELCCHLLIVPPAADPRNDDSLLNRLQKIVIPGITASSIVHKRKGINEAICNRSRFFASVSMHGIKLYDSGEPLLLRPYECSAQVHLETARQEWSCNYARAISFFNGAAYYQSAGAAEQVVFCLHQALEQVSMALLKAIVGYRPSTHNLDRLLSQLRLVGLHSDTVFPANTPGEELLFRTLKLAYRHSRYTNDYTVLPETAAMLIQRVELILKEAERLYLQQLQDWQCEASKEMTTALTVAFVNTLNPAS